MSQAKRMIEQQEMQRAAAIEILVRVGVLRRCEHHSHIVMEGNRLEMEAAYRLGNSTYTDCQTRTVRCER